LNRGITWNHHLPTTHPLGQMARVRPDKTSSISTEIYSLWCKAAKYLAITPVKKIHPIFDSKLETLTFTTSSSVANLSKFGISGKSYRIFRRKFPVPPAPTKTHCHSLWQRVLGRIPRHPPNPIPLGRIQNRISSPSWLSNITSRYFASNVMNRFHSSLSKSIFATPPARCHDFIGMTTGAVCYFTSVWYISSPQVFRHIYNCALSQTLRAGITYRIFFEPRYS